MTGKEAYNTIKQVVDTAIQKGVFANVETVSLVTQALATMKQLADKEP